MSTGNYIFFALGRLKNRVCWITLGVTERFNSVGTDCSSQCNAMQKYVNIGWKYVQNVRKGRLHFKRLFKAWGLCLNIQMQEAVGVILTWKVEIHHNTWQCLKISFKCVKTLHFFYNLLWELIQCHCYVPNFRGWFLSSDLTNSLGDLSNLFDRFGKSGKEVLAPQRKKSRM